MVSTDLRRTHAGPAGRKLRRALCAGALTALAACRGAAERGATIDADSTALSRVVGVVQARYGSSDAMASGAFTWTAGGVHWVLIDVRSTVPGMVQARADLWAGNDSGVVRMGQSDVFPSAAEIGAWAFEDVTGDGLPDLLGWVADSAGVVYPVFVPGASGTMSDELELSARGWRLATDEDLAPRFLSGSSGACAIQVWAEDPAPDGGPAGWRFLVIRPEGRLSEPLARTPACP